MRIACIFFQAPIAVEKIAEHFLRFSPQICVGRGQAIFVEIGKCQSLYSEQGFLFRSQVILRRLNLNARIAVGSDITDAFCLARYNQSSVVNLPLESLIDFADPFLRDEQLQKAVYKMISSFQDLGIKSIGDFLRIPVSDLIGRFGVIGRHCHQRVKMESPIHWPHWKPEDHIAERKEFPYFEFYGELEPIAFELKSQLDRIFHRLWARSLKARKLRVNVVCERNSQVPNNIRSIDFNFFAPQGSTKGTLKILRERLSREFEKDPIKSPIEAIETTVMATSPANPGQRNFLNSSEEKLEQLSSIHNQLIEICGLENIFQAELTEDRRPEKSWTKIHINPHEPGQDDKEILATLPERPTFLCRKPIRVEVTAGYVHINRKRHLIKHWDPFVERISGAWIEDPKEIIKSVYDRNYYHVELESGQRIFLFETPNREFYLHGYYG